MTGNQVFLTFDDGPVPGVTSFVLDTLAKFSAGATFFCIGDNIRKHPDLAGRINREGHAMGNHTFHHLNGWKTPAQDYHADVARCDAEIDRFAARSMLTRFFRPPYGRITRAQIRTLDAYKIIMWDALSYDFERKLSPETALRGVIAATRPGSIVVFHDSEKAEKNLNFILPRFLEHFAGLGYSFGTLR